MSTLESVPVRQQEIEIALKTFYNTIGLGLEARPSPFVGKKTLSLGETLEDPISLERMARIAVQEYYHPLTMDDQYVSDTQLK